VLACGPHAALSHRSAAALWGLPIGDNGLTYVIAGSDLRRPRIAVHRSALDPRTRSSTACGTTTRSPTCSPALSARLKRYVGDRTLTQTELEDAFLALCRRHGIPEPITQFGRHPRVDFHWPAWNLVVEVDGYQAHGTRIAFQADRTNTNRLLLQGQLVLRYTHEDIADRDTLVARQVLSAGNRSRIHSAPSSARRYGLPPTST
jgi:hypothetical protein